MSAVPGRCLYPSFQMFSSALLDITAPVHRFLPAAVRHDITRREALHACWPSWLRRVGTHEAAQGWARGAKRHMTGGGLARPGSQNADGGDRAEQGVARPMAE